MTIVYMRFVVVEFNRLDDVFNFTPVFHVAHQNYWRCYNFSVQWSPEPIFYRGMACETSHVSGILIISMYHCLLQAALSHAREQQWKVKLSCSYLQHYVSKHIEFKDVIVSSN